MSKGNKFKEVTAEMAEKVSSEEIKMSATVRVMPNENGHKSYVTAILESKYGEARCFGDVNWFRDHKPGDPSRAARLGLILMLERLVAKLREDDDIEYKARLRGEL